MLSVTFPFVTATSCSRHHGEEQLVTQRVETQNPTSSSLLFLSVWAEQELGITVGIAVVNTSYLEIVSDQDRKCWLWGMLDRSEALTLDSQF